MVIGKRSGKHSGSAASKGAASRASSGTRRHAAASKADGDELLGRAERIVAAALARGADQAECYLQHGASLDVELEAGRIANTAAGQGQGAGLRIIKDGRLGYAYLTQDDQAGEAADQALRQARHAPKKNFALPSPNKPEPLARWDDDIAALEVGRAIGLANGLLAGARADVPKATVAGGGASLSLGWLAIASSEGVGVWDRSTSVGCSISLTLQEGERAISAGESMVRHALTIDPADVVGQAAEVILSLRKPKAPGPSRRCHVMLRPEGVAELVAGPCVAAATGDDARRGKTVWRDKLGKAVAASAFTLTDDSRVRGAIGGVPFDDEGVPARRVPIVEKGVLRNFLYDSWDAHRHKATSTSSATRVGFKSRPETGTHHLVISSPDARPVAKLLEGIDDGYLVESVLGAHTANPTTGDFSVTAPNVWRIVDGAVAGPVKEIAIAGSLTSLLAGLDGVSKEFKAMDGARMPHLLFKDVAVST